MHGLSRQPVSKADAHGAERRAVSRFLVEEAGRLLGKGVEAVVHRKISRISRNACPEDLRRAHGLLLCDGIHLRQPGRDHVFQLLELIPVFRPDKDIEVRLDGKPLLGDGLVQEIVRRVPCDHVLAAVGREGLEPQPFAFQLLDGLLRILDEDVLVIDMVAGKQLAQRRGEAHAELAPVGGIAVIVYPAPAQCRKVGGIAQGVELAVSAAYFQLPLERHVAHKEAVIFPRKEAVALDQAEPAALAAQLVVPQPAHGNKAAVFHDPLELADAVQEILQHLRIEHLVRHDRSAQQVREERACRLPSRRLFRQHDIAAVVEVWALVEKTLAAAAQEAGIVRLEVRPIPAVRKPVLLVHDAVFGKHFQRLHPCLVEGLVLLVREREYLGQLGLEHHCHIALLAYDTVVLYFHDRQNFI